MIFVKLGDVDATKYRITASWDDPKLGAFEEKFVRASEDFFAGMLNSPVGERLKLLHLEDGLALPSGETLRVGRAGTRLPGTITYSLRAFQESYETIINEEGKYELHGDGRFTWRPVDEGSVEFVLLEGAGVFEPPVVENSPTDEYKSTFVLGPDPGLHRYGARVTAKLYKPLVNPDTGEVSQKEFELTSNELDVGGEVWGAEIRFVSQQPDPIFVDGNGHIEDDTELGFEILPPEIDPLLRQWPLGRQIGFFENGAFYGSSELPDGGSIAISPNIPFDPNKVYEFQFALLLETEYRVLSELQQLKLFNAYIAASDPAPSLAHRDVEGNYVTQDPTEFRYYIQPSPVSWSDAKVRLIEINRQTGLERPLADLPGNSFAGKGEALLDPDSRSMSRTTTIGLI